MKLGVNILDRDTVQRDFCFASDYRKAVNQKTITGRGNLLDPERTHEKMQEQGK
jgi:hypothetical protein